MTRGFNAQFGESRPSLPVFATIGSAVALCARVPVRFAALAAAPTLTAVILGVGRGLATSWQHGATQSVVVLMLIRLFVVALSVVAHGAVTIGGLETAATGTFAVRPALAASMRRLWPLAAIACLQAMLVVLGLILLIIPGLIAAAALCVAQPACLAEGLGPIQSLKRSFALTKGHRWSVAGIVLTYIVAEIVLIGVTAVTFTVARMPVLLLVFTTLAIVVVAPVGYMLATAIYLRLRDPGTVAP